MDQFPERFGRIWRVVYSASDWDAVTQRRFRAAEVFVSLASFPGDNMHRVLLKSTISINIVQVLVIPPHWDRENADRAMRDAADPSSTASATTILDRYRGGVRPDPTSPGVMKAGDDDGA